MQQKKSHVYVKKALYIPQKKWLAYNKRPLHERPMRDQQKTRTSMERDLQNRPVQMERDGVFPSTVGTAKETYMYGNKPTKETCENRKSSV